MMRLAAVLFLLIASPGWAQVVTQGLTLPDTSGGILVPLLADETRRAAMLTAYNASPASYPHIGSNPTNCLTTSDSSGCQGMAAKWAMVARLQEAPRSCTGTVSAGTVIDNCAEVLAWLDLCYTQGTSCWQAEEDDQRYDGEYVTLTVLWMWEFLDATQRENWVRRIAQRNIFARSEQFGDGCNSPEDGDRISNYNWGFGRNQFWAGVAFRQLTGYTMPASGYDSASVNPSGNPYVATDWNSDDLRDIAQEMLVDWRCRVDNLVTFMSTHRGGVSYDGGAYGQYLEQYYASIIIAADDYGLDLTATMPWLNDHAWWLLYHTTPKETYHASSAGAYTIQFDSFGATNLTSGRMGPDTVGTGTWAAAMLATHWGGTNLGAYMRHYATNSLTAVEPWVKLIDASWGDAGTDVSTAGLATDHWAVGSGRLMVRTTWDRTASPTTFYFNLGNSRGHHLTRDAGGEQVHRCGTSAGRTDNDCWWLRKESSCYGQSSNFLPNTNASNVDCVFQWGQNLTSIGHANGSANEDAEPSIDRVVRTSDYVVATVDLSNMYPTNTAFRKTWVAIKPRSYYVTFERIATASSATAKVTRIQCPNAFTNPATDQYRCTMNSAHVLDTFVLSGSVSGQSVGYTTRTMAGTGQGQCTGLNGNCDPQDGAIDISTTGTATSYLVRVDHARASGDTAMSTPTLSCAAGVCTVTVAIGAVTDVITFADGTADGTITINLNGGGASTVATGVATVTNTTTSFAWDGDAPDAPSGRPSRSRLRIR